MGTLATAILACVLFGSSASIVCRAADEVQSLTTGDGVALEILGLKPAAPAPTLFILALDAKSTLTSPLYRQAGNVLRKQGYLCVSVDLPCHGAAKRAGEPSELAGWRRRIDAGDDPMAELTRRLKSALDFLIAEGYTDAQRVAACGTSRGGFSALHFAAADPRVRCVAAYIPVTDLKALREFRGAENAPLVQQLALDKHADRLAGRAVWIAIGDRDERVDTDAAIRFARALSAAAAAKKLPSQVELHVCPAVGHRTPDGAAEQSAAWISRILGAAATHAAPQGTR
jgi:dienelactone hydrolase